jgi:formate dehydrogenase subunit gamma
VIWVKDNFPHPRDLVWLLKGGGLIGHWAVPAGRFNGGQKLIFWSVVVGGMVLSASGLVKMFPFSVTDIGGMQLANIVHALGGIVLMAIIIAHIYIGSLGMEGAFEAMGSGKVDLNWAKEHHSVWVEKMSPVTSSKPTPAE